MNDFNEKYRPRRWSSVVGHSTEIKRLRGIISSGKKPSALLFAGPSGIGKTTFARLFADYINCETQSACKKCSWCASSKIDLLEVNAAEARGIDEVRALIDNLRFKPRVGKYKVVILNEVQQLTPQAQQALLDAIEPPPPHVVFILTSMESHKLHKALVNRCSVFRLEYPTQEEIKTRLEYISRKEGINLTGSVLDACASSSAGCVRQAVSNLQACDQYCTQIKRENKKITPDELERLVLSTVIDSVSDVTEMQAVEALDAIYSGDFNRLHKALIDSTDFPGLIIKLTYINMYVLDSEIIRKHPKIWPTPANLKIRGHIKDLIARSGGSVTMDTIIQKAIKVISALVQVRRNFEVIMSEPRSSILSELAPLCISNQEPRAKTTK